MEYLAFHKEYFKKHQKKLLALLNYPLLKVLYRYLFRIDSKEKIHEIAPHYYTVKKGEEYTTDFRTHMKYSKALYRAFKPFWWMLHYWDEFFADRLIPKLSFGFNTLTVYPDTGSGATTCDGYVLRNVGGETFAVIRAGTGTSAGLSDHATYIARLTTGVVNLNYTEIDRGFFTFDTSTLDDVGTPTISATSLNLYGFVKTATFSTNTPLHACASTQASNNTLVVADLTAVGSTSYGNIAYASFDAAAYNQITFNATGISAVQTNGITKIATRLGWDIDNSAPTWGASAEMTYGSWMVDEELTTKDPYLLVTYTISVEKTFTETALAMNDTGTQQLKVLIRTLLETINIREKFRKFLNGLVFYWSNKFSSRSTTWSDKNSDRDTTWTDKY